MKDHFLVPGPTVRRNLLGQTSWHATHARTRVKSVSCVRSVISASCAAITSTSTLAATPVSNPPWLGARSWAMDPPPPPWSPSKLLRSGWDGFLRGRAGWGRGSSHILNWTSSSRLRPPSYSSGFLPQLGPCPYSQCNQPLCFTTQSLITLDVSLNPSIHSCRDVLCNSSPLRT